MSFWGTLGKIGLGVLGGVAAPFTGGASLPLMLAGMGIGAGTGALSALGGGGGGSKGGSGGGEGMPWWQTAIAAGIPVATVIAAMSTGGGMGSKVLEPQQAPPMYPELQGEWGKWLQSWMGKGVPGYEGQLYPNLGDTLLPQVWGAWQGKDPGTQFLENFLQQPQGNQGLLDLLTQTQQWGGPQGRATDLINNMSQWGGTGGPGNQAMSYLMQFGAPSQAGQYAANMAQFGIPSMGAGGALAARAATPASSWLAPFLTLNPSYTAPNPGRA